MTTVFTAKLNELRDTVALAASGDLTALGHAMERAKAYPVAAVGSGGSVIAAEFLSSCRSWLLHSATAVSTPMAFALDPVLPSWGVWLFTASGENPDIHAAFETAVKEHARRVEIVTARAGRMPADGGAADVAYHNMPIMDKKDGFLATHSLVSTITSLLLASDLIAGHDLDIRRDQVQAKADGILSQETRARTMEAITKAWGPLSDTILILHDPTLTAAASMVETCCWEAGMCGVQRTDFRNFAHGRHVWLNRHPERTVIISLTCDRSLPIWLSVAELIPTAIARVHFNFGAPGRHSLFNAVLKMFGVVEALGAATGVDPGKPSVADFGKRLYESKSLLTAVEGEDASTRRKRRSEHRTDEPDRIGAQWKTRRDEFLERLKGAVFGAIVLDYDGTMVATDRRNEPPTKEVIDRVQTLLDGGVAVALATGRGGSVGEELRRVLCPAHSEKVLVGYYNGALTLPLSVDLKKKALVTDPAIRDALRVVKAEDGLFANGWLPKESAFQITIEIDRLRDEASGLRRLRQLFGSKPELKFFRSGHSIDICPSWAGKALVLKSVRTSMMDPSLQMLAVGDSGDRQGNDFELLEGDFGLSVDRVCEREISCWNLFPGDVSGPDGLLRILRGMQITSAGRAQLDVSALTRL